jgi:hypothetical protein
MIISNIIGGLGNQMFQYAAGRALSLRLHQPLKLAIDQFNTYDLHNGLEIDKVFRFQPEIADGAELKKMLGWQASPIVRRLLGRPAGRFLTSERWLCEPHFHHWPGIATTTAPAYMHGYWQSERYFADAAETLRDDFIFSLDWDDADSKIRDLMLAGQSVSVHVRRGDYTNKKNASVFAPCTLDYYRSAINWIRERVSGMHIFVFSDDPDWAMANLQPEFGPITTVRHNTGSRSPRDMRLMSIANHNVIANSSFSWWGAWLNITPGKMVIAPRQWFLDETRQSSRDLVPYDWRRV